MRFSTFLILLLAFSQISINICGALVKGGLLRKKSSKKSSRKSSKKSSSKSSTSMPPSRNKYYQLFVGMLVGLADLSDSEVAKMSQCLPSEWQAADSTGEESKGASSSGQSSSDWTTILDGLEKIIGIVCKFKEQIKKMVTGRIRRYVMKYQYKMLLQKSMSRYKKAVGFFDSIKKGVSNLADIGFNAIKGTASVFVKNVKVFIDTIRQKFTAFLKSDLIQKIKLFYECIQNARSAGKKVIDAIKRLIELAKKIMTIIGGDMVALGKLIIDLICNFPMFRKAFTYLSKSLNTQDQLIQYSLIGKFIGTFLNAAAVRRRNKHKKLLLI
jgi:hypothetical protein